MKCCTHVCVCVCFCVDAFWRSWLWLHLVTGARTPQLLQATTKHFDPKTAKKKKPLTVSRHSPAPSPSCFEQSNSKLHANQCTHIHTPCRHQPLIRPRARRSLQSTRRRVQSRRGSVGASGASFSEEEAEEQEIPELTVLPQHHPLSRHCVLRFAAFFCFPF